MSAGLIGRKIGMTQIFNEDGRLIPVTVLEVGPCIVVQKKTQDKDGYSALQLGFGTAKKKRLSKAELIRFEKIKIDPKKNLKEFRYGENEFKVGDIINLEQFKNEKVIKVTAKSKGKGFQGVLKRYGHRGGPKSHGSRFHRTPGSIGACADPGKVFKGTKLPGHKGDRNVTIKSEIHSIDEEKNIINVIGAVPGINNGSIFVEKMS